jgi:hypothetical protein
MWGGVAWGSGREGETSRLVRKANRIAAKLGMEGWADPIRRPLHMRTNTFAKLAAELDVLQVEITRRAKARNRALWDGARARSAGAVGHIGRQAA